MLTLKTAAETLYCWLNDIPSRLQSNII